MKLVSKVSKNKRTTPHLIAAALAVGALLGTAQAQAEASKVNFVTRSNSLSNDRGLMEAERDLLHSLAAHSLETRDASQPQVKQESAAPKERTKGDAGTLAHSSTSAKSPGETTAARAGRGVKAPSAKQIIEAKAPDTELVEKARSLEHSNSKLKNDLQSARDRIAVLEQQLIESRSQLAIAETEVNRLSGILDSKTRASMGKYNFPVSAVAPAKPVPAHQNTRATTARVAQPVVDERPPAADADLQVATVAVDKADLRLGPGKNHSALMSLRRGSRLMVEARQGEWYRVFAPNGDRAWIAASLVSFGEGASTLNDGSSVRVRGFTASAEEEAFRRVHRPGK